jgi:hypothetical protein
MRCKGCSERAGADVRHGVSDLSCVYRDDELEPDDRITRALAMLDGLRREHEPDCAKERARPGLENFCCCMFGGADEHNAKLDAVRDVLRGGTEGGR